MLQSDPDVKSKPPKQRMAEISKMWKKISESQKALYEKEVRAMQDSYKLDFASYLEGLSPEEREIEIFFKNCQNVAQLVKYLSLEDKKGKDKFSGTKFWMFKQLFRNHGNCLFETFKPHLEILVKDNHESSQRCGAEIIAG